MIHAIQFIQPKHIMYMCSQVTSTYFTLSHKSSYLQFVNQPSEAFWPLVKLASRLQLLESRASNSRRAPPREVGRRVESPFAMAANHMSISSGP